MFREKMKSNMCLNQFGIGSVIQGSSNKDRWLVFGLKGSVGLIDLDTMQKVDGTIIVDDINFLSEREARWLVGLIKNNYTFTDYTFSSSGLKANYMTVGLGKTS